MHESTKESPLDRGELQVEGRCQVCGQIGPTVAMPAAPAPNQFCARCAIEYAEVTRDEDDLGA